MRKVSPEVERLMWLIAEDRDPRAIADFESRFPDLKYELSKHISMVNGLKTAGRKVPPHTIPRFVPKYAAPKPGFNRGYILAFAALLAASALGSWSYFSGNSHSPTPVNVVSHVPPDSPPNTIRFPETGLGSPNPGTTNAPNPTTGSNPLTTDMTPPAVHVDDPMMHPVSFPDGTAPLKTVIASICKQAGLIPEMAPGMPEVEVVLNYHDQPAGEVLEDLGKKYGFTARPQEKGAFLMVPTRPDSDAASTQSSPSTEQTGPSRAKPQKHTTDGGQ